MPSSSKAQFKFMEMMSYNKELAEKRNFDQETAREWHKEDMKKKKDDPEWWDNLPEHAPEKKEKAKKKKGGKDKSEESHEGLFDSVMKMFGIQPTKSAPSTNNSYSEDVDNHKRYNVYMLASDPNLEEKVTLNDGPINVQALAQSFHLKAWSPQWLSQVERNIAIYRKEVVQYLVKRNRYTAELAKIYKRCEAMTPEVALQYATKAVADAKAKMPAPKAFSFPDSSAQPYEKKDGSFGYNFRPTANAPVTIPPIDIGTLKKILKLIDAVDDINDDDIVWGGWSLDDTDEVKWWEDKFPNEDEHWGPMLDLFPCAGEYYEYDVYELTKWMSNISEALRLIVGRAIKDVK